MAPTGVEVPLFAGRSAPPEHGLYAEVSFEADQDLWSGAEQAAFTHLGRDAFRAAPLLRLLGTPGSRKLVVGQVRVGIATGTTPHVTVVLDSVWTEAGGWSQELNPTDHADEALTASLSEPAHTIGGGDQEQAAVFAKAVCESSRNEVNKLRMLRYQLERRLADHLASRTAGIMRPLLAELVELSIAFHRAADHAQATIREGLWLWLSDDRAYHLTRAGQPGPDEPMPIRMQHAAIRQCEAMQTMLSEETARLHALLDSMATVAVAQDAEAQQRFNLIAASIAAGLGLPALILALYSAQPYLPLDSFDRAWRALTPIAVTTLLAAVLALARMPGKARPHHYGWAVLSVLALIAILLFAGALVPH